MKFLINILLIIFCFNCSSSKPEPSIEENNNSEENTPEEVNKNSLFIENAEPFYPIKETVEDIQGQVDELRSRIIDYEERIATSHLNNNIICFRTSNFY